MKYWPLGVAALLGLIGGWALFRCTPDPFAQERADSLAAVRQHLVAGEVARAHNDSVARDSVAKLGTIVTKLGTRAQTFQRRADSLAADLRAVLGGVRRADLDSLIALKDSVHNLDIAQISSLQSALALATARWNAADSAVKARDKLLDAYKLQLDAALKRGSPRCLLGPSASVGFHGYALGAGITCRV